MSHLPKDLNEDNTSMKNFIKDTASEMKAMEKQLEEENLPLTESRTSYYQDLKIFASKVAQIVLGIPAGQPWLFENAIHALKKKYHTLPEPEGFPQPSGELGRILELENQVAYYKTAYKTLEEEHDHCIDIAWGIIANCYNGDWSKGSPDWTEAAAKWRDTYLPETSRRNAERAKLTEEPVSLPESIHKKFAENVSRILTGNIDATREPLTLHVLEATIRIMMSDSWAYMESRKGSVMNFSATSK